MHYAIKSSLSCIFLFFFINVFSQSDEYCHLISNFENSETTLLQDDYFAQNKKNIIVGNFLKNPNDNIDPDEIILIDNSGKFASMYSFCFTNNFKKIWSVSNESALFANWVGDPTKDRYIVLDYNGDGKDELLCVNATNGFDALLEYNADNNSCFGNTNIGVQHWSSFYISGDNHIAFWATANSDIYLTGDYNGNERNELLCINSSSEYWQLYEFNNNGWQLIADGTPNRPMFGNFETHQISNKSISGKFIELPNNNNNGYKDVVFTVWDNTFWYAIQYFDVTQNTFVGYFSSSGAKKLGQEGIRTDDFFYKVNFNGDCTDEIVRYNRTWRYDMKLFDYYEDFSPLELSSNFYVKGNIDFEYQHDSYKNPKFYDSFLPLFGNFILDKSTSILTFISNNLNSEFWIPPSVIPFSSFFEESSSDCPLTTLPIDIIQLKASINVNIVDIEWLFNTSLEINSFELEKSQDAESWVSLTKTPVSDLTHKIYSFQDYKPYIGDNYYRLKIIDIFGNIHHSKIVNVIFDSTPLISKIYPNPTEEVFFIELTKPSKEFTVCIISVEGKNILDQKFVNHSESEVIIKTSNFSKGVYFVKIYTDNDLHTHKIIIK